MANEIIDRAALDQLLATIGGDRTFLNELIYTYLVDAPRLIELMQRAVEAHDATELRRAAHTLKSNSANLGANELAQACRELEDLAKRGELEDVAVRLANLEAMYAQVQHELGTIRAKGLNV